MTDAICRDDRSAVQDLILQHPELLHEDARGVKGNWGPPMSYAANLGRNRLIEMLRELGAQDVQFAFDRACLQGQIETARLLHAMGARPVRGSVMGPCETLNGDGLAFLLESGAEICDEHGDRLSPVALILERYGATRPASTSAWTSSPGTASICRTLPPWRCTAAGSIGSSNCSSAIPASCRARSRTRISILPSWAATRITRWRCTAPRSTARRCCTCVLTTTSSTSRAG